MGRVSTLFLRIRQLGLVGGSHLGRMSLISIRRRLELNGLLSVSLLKLHSNTILLVGPVVLIASHTGPGTNPTPIGTESAFLYAPLVYVDAKPEDPSKHYQSRGITLVSISAPSSGPTATRVVDLLFPGNTVPFGGFAGLLGAPNLDSASTRPVGDRDAYLFGYTDAGLQIARITLDDITNESGYTFFQPNQCNFTKNTPDPSITDPGQIYLTGTYASGSVFYSPYFQTFLFIYLDKFADSTFYIRYLDLEQPSCGSSVWIRGGKNGTGIGPDDAEAIVWYDWSAPQTLYISPTGKGGFNYAGFAHPEFFNRQYLSPSLYPDATPDSVRRNNWYGSKILAESAAGGDGKNLLLSWTSQEQGGFGTGIYQVMLARLEFDDIPPNPAKPTPTMPTKPSSTSTAKPSHTKSIAYGIGDPNGATLLSSFCAILPKGLAQWTALCHVVLCLGFWFIV